MEPLSPFDPSKLGKLFKHFLGSKDNHLLSRFNPSEGQIEQHEGLQKIFDGRPWGVEKGNFRCPSR